MHAQWNKYPAAESLYKQALDIYQNAYGADHIMVAKVGIYIPPIIFLGYKIYN